MRSLLQATPAYELSVDIASTSYGHSIRLISFVPTARRPEDQVKFQGVFNTAELTALRDALNLALGGMTLVEEIGGGQKSRPSVVLSGDSQGLRT
jgi:hypothetical protein